MATTVSITNNVSTVSPNSKIVEVVTAGVQGPQGAAGANGSGNVVSSEVELVAPVIGQQWFKPSTEKTSIWTGSAWRSYVYEDELASDLGSLDANGGYF